MSCCIDEYQEIVVNISDETPIIVNISETEIIAKVDCFISGGDTTDFPQYVLNDQKKTVNDFGQYVVTNKTSLILNGTSSIILGQGSEIIV